MARADRIKDLIRVATEYIDKEETRLDAEVTNLTSILNGRTGGAGITQNPVKIVQQVSDNALTRFLEGE